MVWHRAHCSFPRISISRPWQTGHAARGIPAWLLSPEEVTDFPSVRLLLFPSMATPLLESVAGNPGCCGPKTLIYNELVSKGQGGFHSFVIATLLLTNMTSENTTSFPRITSPDDPAMENLVQQLQSRANDLELAGTEAWPSDQLATCGHYGVYQWFLAPELGGQGWSDPDWVQGYLRLSSACLTTTFIITQRTGACRRIASGESDFCRDQWLPGLLTGELFTTVGISHLTTSHQHLGKPVLRAEETSAGFVLDGFSPWVTGAPFADIVVIGATLEDQRQILVALPTDTSGVTTGPSENMVALSASRTGRLNCERVLIDRKWLLSGPTEHVMGQAVGANTGGLQTSTLAVGLADAAISFLAQESQQREELQKIAAALRADWDQTRQRLLQFAAGDSGCDKDQLRMECNHLAMRSTQASLAAAKGTGYLIGHAAGRWCREALFFLIWSCPQPVMSAHLCELAGITD